jgi:hypothetical protein
MALFRYSPYAPSWGKFGVNALIVGSFFSFYAKAVPKSPSRWPMLQTFSLLTLLQSYAVAGRDYLFMDVEGLLAAADAVEQFGTLQHVLQKG